MSSITAYRAYDDCKATGQPDRTLVEFCSQTKEDFFRQSFCTDSDCQQYAVRVNEYCWYYFQKENDGFYSGEVSAIVDLRDYAETEIEECINTYGYTIMGDSRFEDIKSLYGRNWPQICCECLFEEMVPELISA